MKPSTIALAILPVVANAYKGDMTHYTPGLGSCGIFTDPAKNEPIVALARDMMNNGPNPNTNPKCGTKIKITNPRTKKAHYATIVDTCWACAHQDIDVNEKLFYAVEPKGDGRVHGIQWGGKAVGRLAFEDMEEDEETGDGGDWTEAMGDEADEDAAGLVEQFRGSARFRQEEPSFVQGCGKMVQKVKETVWRFW